MEKIYENGTKVRINKGEKYWGSNMDKWVGKIMTIDGRGEHFGNVYYLMREDHGECIGQEHDGFRWFLDAIEPINNYGKEKIVVVSNGNETVAKYFRDGKYIDSRSAKKFEADKGDFAIGSTIATLRMNGYSEQKINEIYKILVRDDSLYIGCLAKVVKDDGFHGYSNGDVVRVLSKSDDDFWCERLSDGLRQFVRKDSVVLYIEKTDKRDIKAGCVAKIVGNGHMTHHNFEIGELVEVFNKIGDWNCRNKRGLYQWVSEPDLELIY